MFEHCVELSGILALLFVEFFLNQVRVFASTYLDLVPSSFPLEESFDHTEVCAEELEASEKFVSVCLAPSLTRIYVCHVVEARLFRVGIILLQSSLGC